MKEDLESIDVSQLQNKPRVKSYFLEKAAFTGAVVFLLIYLLFSLKAPFLLKGMIISAGLCILLVLYVKAKIRYFWRFLIVTIVFSIISLFKLPDLIVRFNSLEDWDITLQPSSFTFSEALILGIIVLGCIWRDSEDGKSELKNNSRQPTVVTNIAFKGGINNTNNFNIALPEEVPDFPEPKPHIPVGTLFPIDNYVGREIEEAQITNAVNDLTVRHIAIIAMPGQGKSRLIREWMFKHYQSLENRESPKPLLYWINVYKDDFFSAMKNLVEKMGLVSNEGASTMNLVQLISEYLSENSSWIVLDGLERWLMRWESEPDADLEDAKNTNDRAAQFSELSMLLKDANNWAAGSKIIITSRALPQEWDGVISRIAWISRLEERDINGIKKLTGLDNVAARSMLEKLNIINIEDNILNEVVSVLEGHPLGIEAVGIYISKRCSRNMKLWETKLWDKIDRHRKGKGFVLAELIKQPLDKLSQQQMLLAQIITYLGGSVRETWLKRLWVEFYSEDCYSDMIQELLNWHIVNRLGTDSGNGVNISIHSLYQRNIFEREMKTDNLFRLLYLFDELLDQDKKSTDLNVYIVYIANAQYVINYLNNLNRYQQHLYNDSDLKFLLADCYNNTGACYQTLGEINLALQAQEKSSQLFQELLEKHNRKDALLNLADNYISLAGLHQILNSPKESISFYNKGTIILEKDIENLNPKLKLYLLMRAYNTMGVYYRSISNLNSALKFYNEALTNTLKLEKIEQSNEERIELSYSKASLYNNLADLSRLTGDSEFTVTQATKAIKILEMIPENYQVLVILSASYCIRSLGGLQYYQNKIGDGIRQQKSVELAKKDIFKCIKLLRKLIEVNPNISFCSSLAKALHTASLIYSEMSEYNGAMDLLTEAVELNECLVRDKNQEYINKDLIMNNLELSNLYLRRSDEGDHERARVFLNKGLVITERSIRDTKYNYLEIFIRGVRQLFILCEKKSFELNREEKSCIKTLTNLSQVQEAQSYYKHHVELIIETILVFNKVLPLLFSQGVDTQEFLDSMNIFASNLEYKDH